MRTTLNIDDQVFREAKKRAIDTGVTLTEFIEVALRDVLARGSQPAVPTTIADLPVVTGKLKPGVDINSRRRLYDVMDGRE